MCTPVSSIRTDGLPLVDEFASPGALLAPAVDVAFAAAGFEISSPYTVTAASARPVQMSKAVTTTAIIPITVHILFIIPPLVAQCDATSRDFGFKKETARGQASP